MKPKPIPTYLPTQAFSKLRARAIGNLALAISCVSLGIHPLTAAPAAAIELALVKDVNQAPVTLSLNGGVVQINGFNYSILSDTTTGGAPQLGRLDAANSRFEAFDTSAVRAGGLNLLAVVALNNAPHVIVSGATAEQTEIFSFTPVAPFFQKVAELPPATFNSVVHATSGTLLYLAGSSSTGIELWRYDLSSNSGNPVSGEAPGPQSTQVSKIAELGGKLVVRTRVTPAGGSPSPIEIRSIDIATGDSVLLYRLPATTSMGRGAVIQETFRLPLVSSSGPFQLLVTNGTTNSTSVVTPDIGPGRVIGASFAAGYAIVTRELSGTRSTVFWSPELSRIEELSNQHSLFAADGSSAISYLRDSAALLATDGTVAGIRSIFSIPDGMQISATEGPTNGILVARTARFPASSPTISGLLFSAGTQAQTRHIEFEPGSFLTGIRIVGDRVFLTAGNSRARRTYQFDFSTMQLAELSVPVVGNGSSGPSFLVSVGARSLYEMTSPATGAELWSTDGFAQGTQLLSDFNPGPDSTDYTVRASGVTAAILEARRTGSQGPAALDTILTDGTVAGTRSIPRLANASESLGGIVAHQGRFLYTKRVATGATELWSMSESDSDRQRIAQLSVTAAEPTEEFAILNGLVFFLSALESGEVQLWSTDGSAAGTRLITTVRVAGDINTPPNNLVAAGGRLYFVMSTRADGAEVWSSRGTAASTAILPQLLVGSGDSFIRSDDWLRSYRGGVVLQRSGPGSQKQIERILSVDGANPVPLLTFDSQSTQFEPLVEQERSAAIEELRFIPLLRTASQDQFAPGAVMIVDDGAAATIRELNLPVRITDYAYSTGGISVAGFQPLSLGSFDTRGGTTLLLTDGTDLGTIAIDDSIFGSRASYANGFSPMADGIMFSANGRGIGLELHRITGLTALSESISTTRTVTQQSPAKLRVSRGKRGAAIVTMQSKEGVRYELTVKTTTAKKVRQKNGRYKTVKRTKTQSINSARPQVTLRGRAAKATVVLQYRWLVGSGSLAGVSSASASSSPLRLKTDSRRYFVFRRR